MSRSWSVANDLTDAFESYTRALTTLAAMPVRWCARSARGVATAFESAFPDADPWAETGESGEARSAGRGSRLEKGAEVETEAGIVGTIEAIDAFHVTLRSGDLRCKVTRRSVRRVQASSPELGDMVRTAAGIVGTVKSTEGRVVTIESGGTTLAVDRDSIRETLERARDTKPQT